MPVAPPTGPAGQRGVRQLARRAGWGVLDQGLSSFGNLAMSVLVARAVDAHGFGAFTVAFSVYSFAVLLSRSLVSQPLAIRFAEAEPAAYRSAMGLATGTALALGGAIGAVVAVVGAVLGDAVGPALLAVGIVLPALLVHDGWRSVFIAQGRPQRAVLVDSVWIALQLGGAVLLMGLGSDLAVPFLVVWGGASAVAAVVGAVVARTPPRPLRARSWVEAHWDMTRFLLFEVVLVQGAFQGALVLAGAIASLSDAGALRGAAVLMGPVSLVAMSAVAFCVPELARRRGMPARKRLAVSLLIGGALAALGLVWGGVVLLAPDGVGVLLLGDSWTGVRSVLLPTVIGQAANLFGMGASCMVLSRGETRLAFRINATVAVLILVLGVGGLVVAGAEGAAWGFLIAYWAVLPLWSWALRQLPDEVPAPSSPVVPWTPAADRIE